MAMKDGVLPHHDYPEHSNNKCATQSPHCATLHLPLKSDWDSSTKREANIPNRNHPQNHEGKPNQIESKKSFAGQEDQEVVSEEPRHGEMVMPHAVRRAIPDRTLQGGCSEIIKTGLQTAKIK